GNFEEFDNSYGEANLVIKECKNKTYLNQDIEKVGFKSCYLPKCTISCNKGKCANINVCDCSETHFKGLYCNEYYEVKKGKWSNIFLKSLSYILMVITIIFMVGIFMNRNDPKVKAASYNFLLIILVGILFNIIYLLLLTYDDNSVILCTVEYLLKNLGFSLVYGSIFVKTLRIYIIFTRQNHSIFIKNSTLYIMVYMISMYHVVTVILFILLKKIQVKPKYTINEERYTVCSYPIWRKISVLFNLSLLFIDLSISYANRHVKKNFKESLTIPVYVYVVLLILMEFISVDYGEKQYIFNACMVIIDSVVILYFIFIKKYFKIFIGKNNEIGINTSLITSKELIGSS
ncbi:hypothetical protein BCR32DRAFT_308153, partial [Anaeromyces robustus]